MPASTRTAESAELRLVRAWRRQRLEAAGYPPREADLLSTRRDVDLHLALRLLERGCSPETAMRILL